MFKMQILRVGDEGGEVIKEHLVTVSEEMKKHKDTYKEIMTSALLGAIAKLQHKSFIYAALLNIVVDKEYVKDILTQVIGEKLPLAVKENDVHSMKGILRFLGSAWVVKLISTEVFLQVVEAMRGVKTKAVSLVLLTSLVWIW